jgi:hypothetical protein
VQAHGVFLVLAAAAFTLPAGALADTFGEMLIRRPDFYSAHEYLWLWGLWLAFELVSQAFQSISFFAQIGGLLSIEPALAGLNLALLYQIGGRRRGDSPNPIFDCGIVTCFRDTYPDHCNGNRAGVMVAVIPLKFAAVDKYPITNAVSSVKGRHV